MSNNFRIEEDLLGKREVPDDVYYGVHTLRAIENFYISDRTINDVLEFIRGMVMVKKPLPWRIKNCTLFRVRLRIPSSKPAMKS